VPGDEGAKNDPRRRKNSRGQLPLYFPRLWAARRKTAIKVYVEMSM